MSKIIIDLATINWPIGGKFKKNDESITIIMKFSEKICLGNYPFAIEKVTATTRKKSAALNRERPFA